MASAPDDRLAVAQPPASELEWTVELFGMAPLVPWTEPLRLGVRTADGSLGSEQFATVAADGTARFAPPTDPRLVHLVLSSTEPNYRLGANTLPFGVMQRNRRERVEVFPQTILRGRVIGPDGAGVGASRVRAYVFRGDYPAEPVVAQANTDRDGNYELLAPPGCPLLILARAMEPENPWMRSTSLLQQVAKPGASLASLADNGRERTDLLPAGVRAHGTHGTHAHVPDVRLPLPSAIRGSVKFPDGSKPEGARIVATPADAEAQRITGNLHWSMRQGFLAGSTTGTDWKGSFELPLAADSTWQVTAMLAERDLMLAGEPSATVRCPGQVDLVLPSNPITVQARAEGKPAADAILQVEGLGEFSLGPTGERRFVFGKTARRLRARTNAGTSAWVTAPTNGPAETVVLEVSASTDAPVDIVLRSVPPVFLAQFHFRPKSAGTAIRVHAERRLVTDPFTMRVPPADYVLDIYGNEEAVQGLYMLPLHLEVSVPADGLRRQDEVTFGGRLVLDVHDEVGVARAGTFSLLDAAGKPVVASFVSGGRDDAKVSEPGHFLAERIQTLGTVLPAGKYLLAVECAGLRSAQQEVTVRPREATHVSFRLR